MIGKSKTKNNLGLISTLKNRKYQYISRSTNKKISKNDNATMNNNNHINKDKYKVTTYLIDITNQQNSKDKDKFKKNNQEFPQKNTLLNIISKNPNNNKNNNNINVLSMPKNKIIFGDNGGSNNKSSLFFNMNEEMKINNNNIMTINKQKNKNFYQGNIGLKNINNLNIQKYNIKKNYEKYINSNNNSLEENCIKNKNNINLNKKGNFDNKYLILESNNENKNTSIHKNKNNDNTNKYIIQQIITNLFSSNKKKPNNNKKRLNNNNQNKYFINDSFSFNNNNNNKISNYNSKNLNNNLFNKEKKCTEKNKETPRLKSSNCNNKKKISGLFSANPKEKSSKLTTEIDNSKAKKINENLTKRNLSINIHSYKVNDYKFKTSIDLDLNFKNNEIENGNKNIPKLNLNQVFNLKLYDKNNQSNNNDNKQNNFVSLNNMSIDNQKKDKIVNINIISNTKNKKLFYINNNKNNIKDNSKNKSNTFIINTKIDEQNINDKNNNLKRSTKFSPKYIYIKGIRKSNIQRFFSYTKNKTNLRSNINFMNNIKKINFNDTKKSTSKNTTRRDIISNDSNKKTNNKFYEIKFLDNKRINNNKHFNISNSAKKSIAKENIGGGHINIRKRKPKYSDINRIIEINNLKCMKYINNSEINNLKKININFSTNEANEFKANPNNNHKRNNHSASHNSINNSGNKYIISKIGNIFKPKIENNIRNSFNERNNKNKNKINYNLLSLIDNKSKEKNNQERNIKQKNKFLGIYESNKKVNEYNQKVNLELNKINLEIDENKTKENIMQNTLTMYSIYIISRYYNTCDKIGLAKISLYDKDKNIIPIEYSITNEGLNANYLFNNNLEFPFQTDIFNESGFVPFISNFDPNFCINFYIKNIHISKLEYIDILNYSNINNGISPVKEIKLFKTDSLLYDGILELKNENIIKINNNHSHNHKDNNDINDFIFDKKKKMELLKDNKKSLTYTIFKSLINENSDFTENIYRLNRYNSARNTFNDNFINSFENNNTNLNLNIKEKNNKNVKSKSFVQNIDFIYNKENENTENIMFYKTSQENSNNQNNTKNNISLYSNKYKDLSNTNFSNLNLFTSELIENEKEINFSKTLKNNQNNSSKLFLNSYNSAYDDCDNLFRTSIGYNGLAKSQIQFYENFIELNKISIYLKANFGHKKYIGLTGIIFFDENNEQIDIEKAKAIGALPKDLRTIYNDDSDNRIFENLFNGINNTNDSDNMWVTRIKKNEIPYFELFFEEKIKLSKIVIYNYNQKDRLEIGTKEIDIYIDNYFFQKFSLIQGTGEIAFIDNTADIKDLTLYNFGQEIFFNNENNITRSNNNESDNNSKEINYEELSEINFASNLFEQCYETPYMPCGNIIKIQFMSYYKESLINNDNNIDDFFIGIGNVQIFNEEGKNVLNSNKYKIISNKRTKMDKLNDKNNKDFKHILLRLAYSEDENGNILYDDENYIFYIFKPYIQIGYIKFFPLDINELKDDKYKNNCYKAKEIKIFCDDKIIYEGFIYNDKPTIILFTSDEKLTKNINEDYLTKNFNQRKIEEVETNNYHSLILN